MHKQTEELMRSKFNGKECPVQYTVKRHIMRPD